MAHVSNAQPKGLPLAQRCTRGTEGQAPGMKVGALGFGPVGSAMADLSSAVTHKQGLGAISVTARSVWDGDSTASGLFWWLVGSE